MSYNNLILTITTLTFGLVIGQNHIENINIQYLFGDESEVWEVNKTEPNGRIILTKRLEYTDEYQGLLVIFYNNGGLKTGYPKHSEKYEDKTNQKLGSWNIDKGNRALTTSISLDGLGQKFLILELNRHQLFLMKLDTD